MSAFVVFCERKKLMADVQQFVEKLGINLEIP